jgi:hypothetical protein
MELLFRSASLFLDNRNKNGARYMETTESRHYSRATLFKYMMQHSLDLKSSSKLLDFA